MKKKAYEKPTVAAVKLDVKQAVLVTCKFTGWPTSRPLAAANCVVVEPCEALVAS